MASAHRGVLVHETFLRGVGVEGNPTEIFQILAQNFVMGVFRVCLPLMHHGKKQGSSKKVFCPCTACFSSLK